MKKFLCMLLAAVLMLSISVSAFASNINTGNQLPGGIIGDNSSIINPGNTNNDIFLPGNNVDNNANITLPGNSNSGGSGVAIPEPAFVNPSPAEDPVVVILNAEEANPDTGAPVLVPAIVALAVVAGFMASKRK